MIDEYVHLEKDDYTNNCMEQTDMKQKYLVLQRLKMVFENSLQTIKMVIKN
mgnify:CR=1 FL=1